MAILCRDLKLLFLQTPHTGSSAVGTTLRDRLGGIRLPDEPVRDDAGTVVVPTKHATLRQLIDGGVISADERRGLTVAAGIRNPFDLVVTAYVRLKAEEDPRRRHPDRLRELERQRTHRPPPDFETYVRRRFAPGPLERLRGRRPFAPPDFAEGADHVIRFERLQDDLDAVLRAVGVTERVEVPVINATQGRAGRGYQEYYTPAARRIVEDAYRHHLERYDYRFESDGRDAVPPADAGD